MIFIGFFLPPKGGGNDSHFDYISTCFIYCTLVASSTTKLEYEVSWPRK